MTVTSPVRRLPRPRRRKTVLAVLAAVGVTSAAVAGCSSSTASPSASSPASPSSGGRMQIAFLSASAANTWLTASLQAMNPVAAKEDATITEFDGKFQPGLQATQIQDIITAGKYKGIIIASIDGAGIIPSLERAQRAGIKVAILNQIVGTKLNTADPQFPGPVVSVLAPPVKTGQRLGDLVKSACSGNSSCKVVYLYGIKGTAIDTAEQEGFKSVTGGIPSIKVVASGQAGYSGTDEGRSAVQDILQTVPHPDVIAATGDQGIEGAVLALKAAGVTGVKLIGVGGSAPAIAGIKDGSWYGDVFGAPKTEGQIAITALIQALRDGRHSGGVDTGTQLPDDGLVTKANVNQFTAQWNGARSRHHLDRARTFPGPRPDRHGKHLPRAGTAPRAVRSAPRTGCPVRGAGSAHWDRGARERDRVRSSSLSRTAG